MAKIDYEQTQYTKVKLDGKYVGDIKPVEGGFAYIPKGKGIKHAGETFPNIIACMRSLEE